MPLADLRARRLAQALEARGREVLAAGDLAAEEGFRSDIAKVAVVVEQRVGPSALLDAGLVRNVDAARAGLTPGSSYAVPSEAVLQATAQALASRRKLQLGDRVATWEVVRDVLELMPLIWWQRIGRPGHAHCLLDSDAQWPSLAGLLRQFRAGDVNGAYAALPAAAAVTRSRAERSLAEFARGPALLDFLCELEEVQRVALALSGRVDPTLRYSAWNRVKREIVAALCAVGAALLKETP